MTHCRNEQLARWLGDCVTERVDVQGAMELPERGVPACHVWPQPTGQRPEDVSPLALVEAWQAGSCALCGAPDVAAPKVDHCHRTGLIRGLLCHTCNGAEGRQWGTPWIVQYRIRPPAVILGATEPYSRKPYQAEGVGPVPADPSDAALFLHRQAFVDSWQEGVARSVPTVQGGPLAAIVDRRAASEIVTAGLMRSSAGLSDKYLKRWQ